MTSPKHVMDQSCHSRGVSSDASRPSPSSPQHQQPRGSKPQPAKWRERVFFNLLLLSELRDAWNIYSVTRGLYWEAGFASGVAATDPSQCRDQSTLPEQATLIRVSGP